MVLEIRLRRLTEYEEGLTECGGGWLCMKEVDRV
jgi:hypothetical protein